MSTDALPPGWFAVSIDAVLAQLEDGRILHHGWSPQCEKEPSQDDDKWGVLKTTAIQDGLYLSEHNKKLPSSLRPRSNLEVHSGDILLTCAGPRNRCGIVCLVRHTRPRLILSGKIYRFRANEVIADPSFLECFLRTQDATTAIDAMKTGISDSGLNLTHGRFLRLQIPIPPLPEQRRIVAKIEELFAELDAAVVELERVRVNLKRYRASVLKAAVTGELTADWRTTQRNLEPAATLLERILTNRRTKWEADQRAKFQATGKTPPKDWQAKYPEPSKADTATLPALPDGWCWASVEQLGMVQLGRQRSPGNVSKHFPTKYIRAANITEFGLDLFDVLEMEFTPKERITFTLRAGDIILSEASGSPEHVGKPAIWRDELAGCCFQNTVLRLRPDYVASEYLLTVFLHFYRNKVFAQISAGVGINHLSASKFSTMSVALPPLAEQEAIVLEVEARLSDVTAAEAVVSANLTRAARLRQSILKEAFAGRLVPQDPADEPAPALLERIQRTAASTPLVKSRRGVQNSIVRNGGAK